MIPHRLRALVLQLRAPERHAPWLTSVLVHLTVLGLLSLMVFRSRPEGHPVAIETRLAPDVRATIDSPLTDPIQENDHSDAETGAALFLAAAPSGADPAPHAESARPLELSPYGDLAAGGLVAVVGEIGSGGSLANPGGEGGAGGGMGFFGSKIDAKRIVFVVDASRSMNLPHPGPTKTRFRRVQLELINAIRQLNSEQEFFVVFFNSTAWPMPAERPLPPTPEVLQRYLRWIAAAKAEGRTFPAAALKLALQLRPDVIYLLTDGRFDAGVVPQVARWNQGRTVIHTIGFADNDGESQLTAIATQNGGRYRFIPPDEAIDDHSPSNSGQTAQSTAIDAPPQ